MLANNLYKQENGDMKPKHSDRVRDFVRTRYIEPARRAGRSEVTVNAGKVHRDLGFINRVPLVCQALGSDRFAKEAKVTLARREGPPSGMSTTVDFVYSLANDSGLRGSEEDPFLKYRGALKDLYAKEGGAEAAIRRGREGLDRFDDW